MSADSAAAPTGDVPMTLTTTTTTTTTTAAILTADLFALGGRAAAARRATLGDRASFVRSRQLLAIDPGTLRGFPDPPATDSARQAELRLRAAWRGPRDAAESWVDEDDLPAVGGWDAARAAGVDLLVGGHDAELHRAAIAGGARSLWRFPFRSGEEAAARHGRIDALGALCAGGLRPWGLLPTPDGEPEGLDTLRIIAVCRLALPEIPHVIADVTTLGPRLAQMALGFGADELRAPIVSERALRLGDNARNPAMTRKEAAILIRGAGLTPCERLAASGEAGGGTLLEEVTS